MKQGQKKFDTAKFCKAVLGRAAILAVVASAVAVFVGNQSEQDNRKRKAAKRLAASEAVLMAAAAKPVMKHIPLSDEQLQALPANAVADNDIEAKCHRVGGSNEARPCLETMRSELLLESARVWRNVLGDEMLRGQNPHWNSNPLIGHNILKEDWERLCLTNLEKGYGTRDEPENYLRTASWCLSTAQIAAEKYNIDYDTRHISFLNREVSAILRWELR